MFGLYLFVAATITLGGRGPAAPDDVPDDPVVPTTRAVWLPDHNPISPWALLRVYPVHSPFWWAATFPRDRVSSSSVPVVDDSARVAVPAVSVDMVFDYMALEADAHTWRVRVDP